MVIACLLKQFRVVVQFGKNPGGRAAQKGFAAVDRRCAPTGMHSSGSVHRSPFCIVLTRAGGLMSMGFDALA